MSRKQQDLYTWLVAVAVLVSQVVLSVMGKGTEPALIAGGFGLLGLPSIRRAQDAVNDAGPEAKP